MSEPILLEGLWRRVERLLPEPKLKNRNILGAGRNAALIHQQVAGLIGLGDTLMKSILSMVTT